MQETTKKGCDCFALHYYETEYDRDIFIMKKKRLKILVKKNEDQNS